MFNNSIEKLVRQRLVVTVKAGCGYDFSGVLLHTDRRKNGQHIFADVEMYVPGAEPQKAAGELYIDRVNVAFVQHIAPRVPDADG